MSYHLVQVGLYKMLLCELNAIDPIYREVLILLHTDAD